MQAFHSGEVDKRIRLVGIHKRFGDFVALERVDLKIEDQELLVLLGPSGCGKTTTLNIVAGLEEPTRGEVYFGEELMNVVPPEQRDISMVFQSIGLYPHLDVKQNIVFPLRLRRVPREEAEERVAHITKLLEIDELMNRKLHELSGGQRQRVAIAKALVKRPRLFLLDEPFNSLDAALRRQFRAELLKIHRQLETTMVFVTHDQEEAMSIADEIALMYDGRIVQKGAPTEVYTKPVNLWVAQFVGTHPINIVDCLVEENEARGHMFGVYRSPVEIEKKVWDKIRAQARSSEVILGIRPEFVEISDIKKPGMELEGEVFTKQVLGSDTLYELKVNDDYIRAISPSTCTYALGQHVYIDFHWGSAFVFDKDTEECIVN